MSALERRKTSEAVADHLLGQVLDGTLRGGDRIDLDRVAGTLGVSRVPVREALMQLERDGLVTLPHYRGAFVAGFDAGTVREAFELYGVLSALTSGRIAAAGEASTLETLGKLCEALDGCDHVDDFERGARQFRRVVNLAASGPHLRALLRSFRGLVPAAARFSIEDALDDERAALRAEYAALCSGDPDAAAAATLDHIAMTADNAVRALRRRGVFGPEERAEPEGPDGNGGTAAAAVSGRAVSGRAVSDRAVSDRAVPDRTVPDRAALLRRVRTRTGREPGGAR